MVFNGLLGGPVNCPQLRTTHVCPGCAVTVPKVHQKLEGVLTSLIVILIILLYYTRIPLGVTALSGGGPKLTLIVIYYIILYYTEFGGVSEKGVKLVLGDPETPKCNPGDYAVTDCVASVF